MVRTTLSSINVDLKDINDVRKTAIINDELLKLDATRSNDKLFNPYSLKAKRKVKIL